jgi:hypothetical protein
LQGKRAYDTYVDNKNVFQESEFTMFKVKCYECKEIATVEALPENAIATDKRGVDFTHVNVCLHCLTEQDSKGKAATPAGHIYQFLHGMTEQQLLDYYRDMVEALGE